ncbi:MAG: hypothetical protein O2887_09275 [Bacteroidetes bacterium]|nr:hypothetical protein [Bacteroidota bacterium]
MKKRLLFWAIPLILLPACYPEVPILDCMESFAVVVLETRNSDCGVGNGLIAVTANGGNGAIEFSVGNGTFQSSGDFSSLRPGIYSINARDETFCNASANVTIVSGISFKDSVKPIFETSCNTPTCHDGTSIDFRIFANIQARLRSIKGLTQTGEMPKNGTLHPSDIEKIVCWIDAGAPDN